MGQPERLSPFLTASAATHAGLIGAAFLFAGIQAPVTKEVYRIDFIGPTAGIANRDPEPAAAARKAAAAPSPAKIPPQAKPAEFARRSNAPLPRPSFLAPREPERPPVEVPAAAPAAAAPAPPAAAGTEGDGSGASVSSDLPNFPYPWYITQVRSALWSRWSANMPAAAGEVLVMFSILRPGTVTDIRIESSSGEGGYDYTALSVVKAAAPFPPLPSGFREPFLKVHVKFTSQ
ncbi:MAG: energy transducer TonB [Elusimicrobia bacterium]|nr:energy transducer TonB [Elusimicrobiota bacterium]